MKNFSRLFKTIKNTFSKGPDPFAKTDATSTFYKKVQAKDAFSNGSRPMSNVVIEDRIPHLDRTLLRGSDKNRVIAKVEELVFSSHFRNISDELQDACEIVHYHAVNDIPVRISLVKRILPDMEITSADVINEQEYEEWLKHKQYKHGEDSHIEIEDTYSMNVEGARGKKAPEDWGSGSGKGGRGPWSKQ